MKNIFVLGTAAMLLAACDGNTISVYGPDGGSGGGGGDDVVADGDIPATLTRDLAAAVYSAPDETLVITLPPFDGSPDESEYDRYDTADMSGFEAYEDEENSSARRYLAFFKSGDNVTVGTVATNVKFNTYFGGTAYSRDGVVTLPTSGIATYEGEYAGLWAATGTVGGDEAPTPVSGDAVLNIDYNSSFVEGAVTNRTATTDGGDVAMPDAVLVFTDLASDGSFAGIVEADTNTGVYGGVVGGSGAEEVGVTMVFTPLSGDVPEEFGAFLGELTCLSSPDAEC